MQFVHENGVPPYYSYTLWPWGIEKVMVTPGSKRYWIKQLCMLLRERLDN